MWHAIACGHSATEEEARKVVARYFGTDDQEEFPGTPDEQEIYREDMAGGKRAGSCAAIVDEYATAVRTTQLGKRPAATWMDVVDEGMHEYLDHDVMGRCSGAFGEAAGLWWQAWTQHKRHESDPSHPKCCARLIREFSELCISLELAQHSSLLNASSPARTSDHTP
jgi:hypothetical protein